MTVKELLSLNISRKYSKPNKKTNEENIKIILEKGKNDEKIQYLFNLKFKEWIDIFTMKKEGNNIVKIDGLHLLLKEKLNIPKDGEIDEKYFIKFVYYLYNFEAWFLSKKDKKSKNGK